MTPAGGSLLLALLLAGAGALALVRAVGGADLTRLAAVVVALVLGWIGAGAWRGRSWALGAAFFLGIFWLWAVVALIVQGRLDGGAAAAWLLWSVAVIVISVRARRADA